MELKIQVCPLPETSTLRVRTQEKWMLPVLLLEEVPLGKI